MRQPCLMRREVLGLLVLLLLAAGLRFYGLDLQSLWNDEGTSVALAQRDLATITRQAAQDIHPPLYYYLLHSWIKLWGISEVAVRSLSALLGVLVVLSTWGLARDLAPNPGDLRPWLAGLLLALSPFQLAYAQETRMYMLVTLGGLCSTWAMVRVLHQQDAGRAKPGAWLIYGVASIAAIYSHYYAFTLLLAQNLYWLVWAVRRERRLKRGWAAFWPRAWRWALAQALILLAYLPWLVASWGSLTRWPAVTESLSLPQLVSRVATVFYLGIHATPGRTTLLLAALGAGVALAGLLGREDEPGTPSVNARWLLALYAATPVVCMYLLSQSRPMYKFKFLLLCTPAYHILQAYGLVFMGHSIGRWLRGAWHGRWTALAPWLLLAIVCVFPVRGLLALYGDERTYRDDYRGIVAYIEATAGPDDAVLVNAPSQIETVNYYYDGPWPAYPLPLQRPIDWPTTRATLQEMMAKHRRIYAIYWATDESDPEGLIEGWLDAHCYKAMDSWFGNLRLVVYAVPQAPAQEIEQPTTYILGDAIALRGYAVLTPQPESGTILQVTLFWEGLAPVNERYKVFVHLLDPRGNIVAQRDSEPVGGSRPTSDWTAGELVRDNYGLLLPAGTPPGDYTLRVGMYRPEDGQRLLVTSFAEVVDALDLATIAVQRSATPPPMAALDMQVGHNEAWLDTQLIGHSLYRLGYEHESELVLHPGDAMRLVLYWRAAGDNRFPSSWAVTLHATGKGLVWTAPLAMGDCAAPPCGLQTGDLLRDVHVLNVPADLAPGNYRLLLAAGNDSDGRLLQRIEITAR